MTDGYTPRWADDALGVFFVYYAEVLFGNVFIPWMYRLLISLSFMQKCCSEMSLYHGNCTRLLRAENDSEAAMHKATNLHADPHLLRQIVPKVNALTRCASAARHRPLHYAKTKFQLPVGKPSDRWFHLVLCFAICEWVSRVGPSGGGGMEDHPGPSPRCRGAPQLYYTNILLPLF
jgi:hypothetical protein